MLIEQIYTGCLAQGAYYIESNGEAAIIDPLRESDPYIKKAEANGASIKYVFETHFHADFVSGHVELAAETGAEIVFGPTAETGFTSITAKDNQEFKLGDISIIVMHTPGHTMESTTYLLRDENGKDHCIFSGDTLFIGDVGRPDLAVKSTLTKEDLAGYLYDSLRTRIMPLSNDVIVYPAHGAGSACGKNMSSETYDTLGNQKATNYALREGLSKEDFIKEVTEGIMPPPQYFPKNVLLNKQGLPSTDRTKTGLKALSVSELEFLANEEGALVLDTRSEDAFLEGHIPNSIFIGLDGTFASWVGTLVTDIQQAIVFISDLGKEDEVVTRLARVGYDNVLGYLNNGINAWKEAGKEVSIIEHISATQLEATYKAEDIKVVDVRKPGEYSAEHIELAENIPLDYLNSEMQQFNRADKYYLHCKSGYRSVIAASILQARGIHIVNVDGGFEAIKETQTPVSDFSCQQNVQ